MHPFFGRVLSQNDGQKLSKLHYKAGITLAPQKSVPLGHTQSKCVFLAPAVTVGETERAMDSTSVFFWPLLLPITL